MSTQTLFDAITLIDDDLIDQAGAYAPKKRKVIHWRRWAVLAACLVLAVGVVNFGDLSFGRGGSSSDSGSGNSTGSSGSDGGANSGASDFMAYAGPVFPLTTTDDSDGISVQRDITLDFAPWIPTWISNEEEAASRTDLTEAERQEVLADYNEWFPEGGRSRSSADVTVTDTYTLTNSSVEEKTISVLYPFVSSLGSLNERAPALTVDGAEAETTLHIGPYSGGFEGAWGSEESGETLNLDQLTGWEGYKTLLEDGSYLEKALSDPPDLSGTPAIVYKLTDAWGGSTGQDAPNPSLRVSFALDYDRTTVLSYGFHAASFDRENGVMTQGFSIRESGEYGYGEPYYLIVVGDDVENMETAAYVTGGTDTEKKLKDFGVTVERYETDLDTILREVLLLNWAEPAQDAANAVDFETYFGLTCDWLLTYGVLAEDGGMDRYNTGWLSDMDVGAVERVCYLETAITIPAGESVTLTAIMTKSPSYDYACAAGSRGSCGYDAVTRLGSTLAFTGQSATLLSRGQIEITNQNFGFDPENGVSTVELDMAVEHYYLEVKRAG